MKKLKLFLCVALFGAIGFGAFSTYDHFTMTAEELALLENVEALTTEEGGGATNCNYYCDRNIEWNCQLSSLIPGGVQVHLCKEYKPK